MNETNVPARLPKIIYSDPGREIRLECHADAVATYKKGDRGVRTLALVRLGGYPEAVRGISDAIYGGGYVRVEHGSTTRVLATAAKQYRREHSHDGPYAEALLRINDDILADCGDGTDGPDGSAGDGGPRTCHIFHAENDMDALYAEIDAKTAVPLLPEFRDYILEELQNRGILEPMEVLSANGKFGAWTLNLTKGDGNIVSAVNDGLAKGAITIPGHGTEAFPDIRSVSRYLNAFGTKIAERIRGRFTPLHDPERDGISPETGAVNGHTLKTAGYGLYDAQLAVAEATKKCLERHKFALVIAECGSGKTKIGAAALHAYQNRLSFRKPGRKPRRHFNVVLCPSHMSNKWVRELGETLPDTFATVVRDTAEMERAYRAFLESGKTCYAIITKEKARDGYQRRPAAIKGRYPGSLACPDCGATVTQALQGESGGYRVPADALFFRKENRDNRKCAECRGALWTALSPGEKSDWIKVTGFGFMNRKQAGLYGDAARKIPGVASVLDTLESDPDAVFPAPGAYRRFPLSTYVRKHMKGRIDGLIIDELHNYNNDSGQGDAMGELFGAAKKAIGMTATLINGYSSGIFHLLYRICPNLMLADGKEYEKAPLFSAEYGVTETVYEIEENYNANRLSKKRKTRERQLPGVSPLVYSRFLMDNAAFLGLADMGKDLPEYEEFPVELEMAEKVSEEYARLEHEFVQLLRHGRDIARKLLSAYLNLLTAYPDQPYGHGPVMCPKSGEPLIEPRDMSMPEELHGKDLRVLEIAGSKIAAGEKVLIYTSWTRLDTQKKLKNLLTDRGYRVSVMTASVPPKRREEWVGKQVSAGTQVMICNPSLVETGLDLNDFTTIIYYSVSYNLFTLRQSSRRSWRINQDAPRIEVYFLYYRNTMQHRAIRLMASKLAVAGVIEGNLTDEGLAAMSDCQDMTTALARELTNGIADEVEDLGAVFKRMAILKGATDKTEARDDAGHTGSESDLAEPWDTSDETEAGEIHTGRPAVYASRDDKSNTRRGTGADESPHTTGETATERSRNPGHRGADVQTGETETGTALLPFFRTQRKTTRSATGKGIANQMSFLDLLEKTA